MENSRPGLPSGGGTGLYLRPNHHEAVSPSAQAAIPAPSAQPEAPRAKEVRRAFDAEGGPVGRAEFVREARGPRSPRPACESRAPSSASRRGGAPRNGRDARSRSPPLAPPPPTRARRTPCPLSEVIASTGMRASLRRVGGARPASSAVLLSARTRSRTSWLCPPPRRWRLGAWRQFFSAAKFLRPGPPFARNSDGFEDFGKWQLNFGNRRRIEPIRR